MTVGLSGDISMSPTGVSQNMIVWQIFITFLHALAIGSTIFRIYRRKRNRQLWWDDHIALVCLFMDLSVLATLWFPNLKLFNIDGTPNPRAVILNIIGSWIVEASLPLLLWLTRVSLALSVVRILPPRTRIHLASLSLVFLFSVAALAVSGVSIGKCAVLYPRWSKVPPFQCYTGFAANVIFACFDVVSDILLVSISIWSFWTNEVHLSRTTRHLMATCFLANVFTALTSLLAAILLLGNLITNLGIDILLAGRIIFQILGALALLACNSLIVVTSIYRYMRNFKLRKVDEVRKSRHSPREQEPIPVSIALRNLYILPTHATPDGPHRPIPSGHQSFGSSERRTISNLEYTESNISNNGVDSSSFRVETTSSSGERTTRSAFAHTAALTLTEVETDPSFLLSRPPADSGV